MALAFSCQEIDGPSEISGGDFTFKIDLTSRDIQGHEHHMDLHELLPKKLLSFGQGGQDHLFEISKYYQFIDQ